MAFTMKSAAPATSTAPTTTAPSTSSNPTPAQAIDCDRLVTQLSSLLAGYCTETTELPVDSELMTGELSSLITGIQALAAEVGVEYDPSKTSTYRFLVTEKGNAYLGGPSVVQQDDGVGLAWGDTVYPIEPKESISSEKWRLIPISDDRMSFVYRPKDLKFPVSIRLNEKGHKSLKDDFVSLFTFGELHGYLKPLGSPLLKINDLDDGCEFTIIGVKEVRDTKSGDRQYAILAVEVEGKEEDALAPGNAEDWADESIYPLKAVKQGYQLAIQTPSGDEATLELGANYKKLHELDIGVAYTVTHYSIDTSSYDGRTWDSAVLYITAPDGAQIRANGNKSVLDSLESQLGAVNDGGQKHECTATLILDGVKEAMTQNGPRRFPRFRFQIKTAEFDRLASLLQKKSA